MENSSKRITAVLGPTNTGKTRKLGKVLSERIYTFICNKDCNKDCNN